MTRSNQRASGGPSQSSHRSQPYGTAQNPQPSQSERWAGYDRV